MATKKAKAIPGISDSNMEKLKKAFVEQLLPAIIKAVEEYYKNKK
jgi:hypothetical protein